MKIVLNGININESRYRTKQTANSNGRQWILLFVSKRKGKLYQANERML